MPICVQAAFNEAIFRISGRQAILGSMNVKGKLIMDEDFKKVIQDGIREGVQNLFRTMVPNIVKMELRDATNFVNRSVREEIRKEITAQASAIVSERKKEIAEEVARFLSETLSPEGIRKAVARAANKFEYDLRVRLFEDDEDAKEELPKKKAPIFDEEEGA